ncbi:hypothetical protein D3C73_379240 [compost metagenome]
MDRVFQTMMVAQHHAQLGLAVMVVNDHAELIGKPADHFRVQRLAGAADNAQLALDRLGKLVAASNQQTISGRRTGEVGNAVFVDHPAGAFEGERAIVEGDRVPHRHRSGHTEIDAVGPTRIGDVPERVLRAQVHGVAGVALERDDGLEWHRQGFRRASGARSEHQQERVFTGQHHRFAVVGIVGQFGPETEIALNDALPFRASDGDDGRAIGDFGKFRAVDRVGDHHFGAGAAETVLDGFRAEGGKQRLIDRANAPGGEHGDQEFDVAWQQAGDLVAFFHALR